MNGVPLALFGTPILRPKLYEPLLLLSSFTSSTTSLPSPLARMDIRLRVSGGGHTSQIYALRQAIAKAVVAYVAKYEDAASALEVRKVLVAYDRTLLVADPRRCEPKKFGGKGARSRYQKSLVYIHSPFTLHSHHGLFVQLPLKCYFGRGLSSTGFTLWEICNLGGDWKVSWCNDQYNSVDPIHNNLLLRQCESTRDLPV